MESVTQRFAYVDRDTGKAIRAAARSASPSAQIQAIPVRGVIGRQDITVKLFSAWNERSLTDMLHAFNAALPANARAYN